MIKGCLCCCPEDLAQPPSPISKSRRNGSYIPYMVISKNTGNDRFCVGLIINGKFKIIFHADSGYRHIIEYYHRSFFFIW